MGKRLELQGSGIFIDLWPLVLSFCGRGWFDVEKDDSDDDESEITVYNVARLEYQPNGEEDHLMLPSLR